MWEINVHSSSENYSLNIKSSSSPRPFIIQCSSVMKESPLKTITNVGFFLGVIPFYIKSGHVAQSYILYVLQKCFLFFSIFYGCYSLFGMTYGHNISVFSFFVITTFRCILAVGEFLQVRVFLRKRVDIMLLVHGILQHLKRKSIDPNDHKFTMLVTGFSVLFSILYICGMVLYPYVMYGLTPMLVVQYTYLFWSFDLAFMCLYMMTLLEVLKIFFEYAEDDVTVQVEDVFQTNKMLKKFLKIFGEIIMHKVFHFFLIFTVNVFMTVDEYLLVPDDDETVTPTGTVFYSDSSLFVLLPLFVCYRVKVVTDVVS